MNKPARNKQYWEKIVSDFILVSFIFCLAYVLSSHFNLSDNYFLWARNYEETLDIDELPVSLLASLAALLWISERRIYESNLLMKQNHALLQRVLNVQEIERKRISQDIHDELGQYLNAIKVHATGLKVESGNSHETVYTAQRIIDTADHGYEAARQMMHSLRPVALDELGLPAAVEHLVDTWQQTHQASSNTVKFELNINQKLDALNDQINIGIFRVVQEALTNIAKHSQANVVRISIQLNKKTIQMRIEDNGIGFNTKETPSGYGLMGMAERVEALGGTFLITSTDRGTLISADMINHTPSTD